MWESGTCPMGLFKQSGIAKEGRSTAHAKGRKEKVWQVWREQPPGRKVPFYKAVGRELGVETRLA